MKTNYLSIIKNSLILLCLLPAIALAQSEDIYTGDAVTTEYHTNAIVRQVFPDGMAIIKMKDGPYRGQSFKVPVNRLAKPIVCLDSICINDAVTTESHMNATVRQVFPDGMAIIKMKDGPYRGKSFIERVDRLALKY